MKKIGIGYENYKRIIDDDCYYIDKTILIENIINMGGMVTLFTRPRRFGKTLALSMLRTFFEIEYDRDGNVVDNRRYFDGKKIMEASLSILDKMGKYPVINLSLKSAKQPSFKDASIKMMEEITKEFARHDYLRDSELLSSEEKSLFSSYCSILNLYDMKSDEVFAENLRRYSTSLNLLSALLKKHHGTNVIILLDEYDVPLENAYYAGFYDPMIGFIRSLFESALKTNDSLEFAAVTGCLRISKESIFTGLNNLKVNSIRNLTFSEAFGFTQDEVSKMLIDYGLENRIEEAKEWYDGYLFGNQEIYNPWSIIKYVDDISSGKQFPEPYWANTSSNLIIKDMVYNADADMKQELDRLISGGAIEKKIHEDITYADIHENEDNLWNFLFFTGYMKKVSERFYDNDIYVTMTIPNAEIESVFKNQIRGWFEKRVKESDRSALHRAILEGDTDGMENYLCDLLGKTISVFDSDEGFYHGFFLSLLYGVQGYDVRSNREEGDGRPDIVLYPQRPKDKAIIFELKNRKKFNEMQDGIEEAFDQIRKKKYEEGILNDGYIGSVSYGVCFCKKTCIIQKYDARP